jgi:hypothetical protein
MTNIVRKIQFETSTQVLDAISFLGAMQEKILALFNQYGQSAKKKLITAEICSALKTNMQIEEEIFYPAIKKVIKENGSISAAIMEHSILKYLIAEIEDLDEDSSVYDIKVSVLSEQVKAHFLADQTKLFPKVTVSKKIDLWAVGAQLAWRAHEIKNPNAF